MKMSRVGMVVVILCILGGLIAAIFTPVLAATLTVPTAPGAPAAPGNRPVLAGTQARPSAPVMTSALTPTVQPTTLASGVTILAQDNFQRPDQTFWGTSSGLRAWGGDANTNPAFAIVNHAGQISGGQGALQATLDVASADGELLLQGTVSQFDENGDANLGLVLRWQDTNNWYKALIDGTTVQVLKDLNGKISILAQHAFKATGGISYSLRFRVMGSNLFAKAWPGTQPEPANWTITTIDTDLTNGMSGVRVKIVPGVVMRVTTFIETSVPNTM